MSYRIDNQPIAVVTIKLPGAGLTGRAISQALRRAIEQGTTGPQPPESQLAVEHVEHPFYKDGEYIMIGQAWKQGSTPIATAHQVIVQPLDSDRFEIDRTYAELQVINYMWHPKPPVTGRNKNEQVIEAVRQIATAFGAELKKYAQEEPHTTPSVRD